MRSPMEVERAFTYHPPQPDQIPRYQTIRDNAKTLAFEILAHCPDSPERTIALRKLQECTMMANASIAINEVQS